MRWNGVQFYNLRSPLIMEDQNISQIRQPVGLTRQISVVDFTHSETAPIMRRKDLIDWWLKLVKITDIYCDQIPLLLALPAHLCLYHYGTRHSIFLPCTRRPYLQIHGDDGLDHFCTMVGEKGPDGLLTWKRM